MEVVSVTGETLSTIIAVSFPIFSTGIVVVSTVVAEESADVAEELLSPQAARVPIKAMKIIFFMSI
jgi:hypothetical protein